MKPMEEGWEENNRDRLLFEYLEGELSVEQTKLVEERLASDASLQGELAYWQEAIIKADFLPTQALEKSLLKAEVNTMDSTSSNFTLILVLLTILFSFLPLTTKKESTGNSTSIKAATSEIIQKQELTYPTKKEVIQQQVAPLLVQKALFTQPTERTISLQDIKIKALPKVQLFSLQREIESRDNLRAQVQSHKIEHKKTAFIRKISGKQRRRIERMKERALQRRMANKFMKGRTPYVVPLDTKNF